MSLRALSCLVCAVLLAGCYQVRFSRRVTAEPSPRYDRWHHNLLAGLWELSEPVRTDRICPNGFARVEQERSLVNAASELGVQAAVGGAVGGGTRNAQGGVGGFFLSLWSPATVRVWCALGKPPEPSPEPVAIELTKPLRIAVLPLVTRTGLSEAEAELFTDSLANELRSVPNVSVVTREDLVAVLDVEQQKQLLGCEEDSSCLAELGGALGVDRIVHGSVGRIGSSFVVNLSSIEPGTGRATGSVNERVVSESNEAFFEVLPKLVAGLLAGER